MQDVDIHPISHARFAELLGPERTDRLDRTAQRAQEVIGEHVVWNVSATARGGGVAEMLASLLAYVRGAGVDTRWRVLHGDPAFFAITKRLHNVLHGEPGDGSPLGDDERRHYDEVLTENLAELRDEISPGDIVLLHDPQTAGMVEALQDTGAHVVWRCHIGRDETNEHTDAGWAFLRRDIERADAVIFSRASYAPAWVPVDRCWVIPPSIDPFSCKNTYLDPDQVTAVLRRAGLVAEYDDATGPDLPVPVHRHDDIYRDGSPPPGDARLVLQVSRWDALKDMAGVLTGFADHLAGETPDDVHLVLAGPATSGVSDDPEGAQVLADCERLWRELPDAVRARAHLAELPMDDIDENALLVNALQRHACVVVQKSLLEGFGLTVTEALWKASPVVASAIGGIRDQIEDGRDGLLVHDPRDLEEFAAAVRWLLDDEERAGAIGVVGRERVRQQFIGDRHLTQYVDLFATLEKG